MSLNIRPNGNISRRDYGQSVVDGGRFSNWGLCMTYEIYFVSEYYLPSDVRI